MGICILKEFPDQTEEIEPQKSEFEEHKSSLLDYQNNETEFNFNLSLAFKESFEKNLSGYISPKSSIASMRFDFYLNQIK